MAVKEMGMVYGSQLVNEGLDKVVDALPVDVMGIKSVDAVDLTAGTLGALSAMGKLPVKKNMATAVEIIGLGRAAKATLRLIYGMATPAVGMRMRPLSVGRQGGIKLTGAPAGIAQAPVSNGTLAPAGY